MKNFLRTPFFWLFFVGLATAAGGLTWYLFPKAYPIINLSITMDRSGAIAATKTFSSSFQVGPCNCLYAVSFNTDEQVKTFVELEGGGKEALVRMMEQKLYLPYTWLVRQFKPFDQHQLFVKFTPDGEPYSFEEIVSEETEGSSITSAAALQKAEQFATATPWNIDLSLYKLVETSQETTPKKRIDHTFTYERIDTTIGEGFYRLKIIVSGDRITKLAHEVKVPDAFNRRYSQMRSANANIAYLANLLMLLLYIMGCSFFGLIYLYRIHWIIWKTPIYWAIFVAFLVSLNSINKLPLSWMEYSTSVSPFVFLLEHGIMLIYSFIFMTLILSMIFIAAESLSRKAFGHHLQLWHIFNRTYASSPTVIGSIITGYLLVPIMLCYTMIFTVITMRYAGWWIPSSSLFSPDILATYFPWLESISLSLQAGFMEECLFRAIPLASAALLGSRFGKRNWFIAAAFILQAIIFGAAHANYPAQPAYARLVELLADSALFGAIYLWLGLLPVIIAHFIYDVFWFGIPIFAADTFSAYFNTAIIGALGIIPLIILIVARIRSGQLKEVIPAMYNRAWQPAPVKPVSDQPMIETIPVTLSSLKKYLFFIALSFGITSWLMFTDFSRNVPRFTISRTDAQEHAILHLEQKYGIDTTWYPVTACFTDFKLNEEIHKRHRFIWQTAGKENYRELVGSYLVAPHWITRLLQYNGTVMERAREYLVITEPNGTIIRTIHKIPETSPGAALSKENAIIHAQAAIMEQFSLSADELHEISAVSDKQPARLDWTITYSTTAGTPLSIGEKRVIVTLAGDEITDAYRTIHIPESWSRSEENILMFSTIITQICQLLIYLIAIIGAIVALMQWHSGRAVPFGMIFLLLTIIFIFELGNSWPYIFARFNTSQPLFDQIFRSFSIPAIILILRAAALAIMFSFVTFTHTHYRFATFKQSIFGGLTIGITYTGIQSFISWLIPSTAPSWPNLSALRFAFPLIANIDSMLLHYISTTIFLLLALLAINKLTHYGTRNMMGGILFCAVAGFIGAGLVHADNIVLFTIAGAVYGIFAGILFYTLLKNDRSMIPIATGSALLLIIGREYLMNGYPFIVFTSIGSTIIIIWIAFIWSKLLFNN